MGDNYLRHIAFYGQLMDLSAKSLLLLDDSSREEIRDFIRSMQNPDGGFKNRAGDSDIYYSLFGYCLAEVFGEQHMLDKLKEFVILTRKEKAIGFIHSCCLVILREKLETKRRRSASGSFFFLLRSYLKERHFINGSYRGFVLFLTLENFFRGSCRMKIAGNLMLSQSPVNEHSPCTEVAARLALNKLTGKNTAELQSRLMNFFDGNNGFKSFAHVKSGDMLSTATALFALKYSGADLRLITPGCLKFIQNNFSGGAFFAGNGDLTVDPEYTFYGLLALGTLAKVDA